VEVKLHTFYILAPDGGEECLVLLTLSSLYKKELPVHKKKRLGGAQSQPGQSGGKQKYICSCWGSNLSQSLY
jgi:hypothetical protein